MRHKKSLNQLTLSLEPKHEVSFASFCWDNISCWKDIFLNLGKPNQEEHFFYIYGEPGSGKSHLLEACCYNLPISQLAVYLPLKNYHEYGPELLNGIEDQSLIAIDDIDSICEDSAFEEALFHLINRVRQKKDKTLILSGLFPPNLTKFKLADLKSRLHLGLSIPLTPLEDEQKKQTLQSFAERRGLVLPANIVDYLMQHYDRNMHTLTAIIRTLDKASLSAKRKITIPFIKAVLEE